MAHKNEKLIQFFIEIELLHAQNQYSLFESEIVTYAPGGAQNIQLVSWGTTGDCQAYGRNLNILNVAFMQ